MELNDIPGFKSGSTGRNIVVGIVYALIAIAAGPIIMAAALFVLPVAVWRNWSGIAEKMSAVPGISPDGGLKSGALTFVIAFVVVGIVAGAGGTEDTTQANNSTQPKLVQDTVEKEPVKDQTETSTPTPEVEKTTTQAPTETPTATPTATPEPTPTATPEPTPTATPEPTPEPESEYQVRVSYDGEWSGAMGGDSMWSVDGEGTETMDIDAEDMGIISANAQKQDDSGGELTIQILKNGEVVEETSTTAEYGIAQVTYSEPLW